MWHKLHLNCHLWLHQRVITNSHKSYNRVIHLLSGCQVSFSGYLLFLTIPRRNNVFFSSGPNWAHFGRVGSNNSSKQRHIELKFWVQVVLRVVQMPFKGFRKAQIFTENFYSTQSLSFWCNFDANFATEDDQNQK